MEIRPYKAYVEGSPCRLPFPATGRRLLESLDRYLRFMRSQEPEIIGDLVSALLRQISSSIPEGPGVSGSKIVEQLIEANQFEPECREVFEAQFDLQRGLLELGEEVWTSQETVKVPKGAFIRALYLPQYLQLKALIDVIGRERGIERMKQCLDWAYAQGPDDPDAPKTIDELRRRQVEGNLRGEGMDWIAGIVSEHQYQNKVTVCAIQRTLAEYDDELMEVVACYPDFALFRKVNPNFCLTRTQTLMGGGNCCDMCYHDERYVSDFVHPSIAVFDAMEAD